MLIQDIAELKAKGYTIEEVATLTFKVRDLSELDPGYDEILNCVVIGLNEFNQLWLEAGGLGTRHATPALVAEIVAYFEDNA